MIGITKDILVYIFKIFGNHIEYFFIIAIQGVPKKMSLSEML